MNYINRIENEILSNPVAFEKLRRQEWHNEVETEVVYNYETISKVRKIAFVCFAAILFPIGLAILAHKLIGKIIFSGWLTVNKHQKRFVEYWVGSVGNVQKLCRVIAKRINVLVDGKVVDAFICGRPENINNGKWILVATGVGRCMEDMDNYTEFDSSFQQNYLFFNYPGVGASEGFPSKTQVVNTYNAMLHFLEDVEKGIGAKEITCWGRSIGGAIQAESLKDHTFKNEVKYTIIRDRTFSRLSDVAWYTKVLKFVGWEFDGVHASERLEELKRDEIILQTAHRKPSIIKSTFSETERLQEKDLYYNIEDPLTPDSVIHDGTISPSSSLAYALLSKQMSWQYKKFISVSQEKGHYTLPSFMISNRLFLS
jgi:hypothetical protein